MRRAVFLDRDGVVTRNPPRNDWVRTPEGTEILPGAAKAIADLNRAGLVTVLVTNQSAVSRGIMTKEDVEAVNQKMEDLLAREGAHLDLILFCPHVEADGCECRKPKPGMILDGARRLSVDVARSFMIGDSPRDVLAARAAGCAPVYVFGNCYEDEAVEALRLRPPAAFPGLTEASAYVIGTVNADACD